MNFVHKEKGRSIKEFKHNFNNQGKFIQVPDMWLHMKGTPWEEKNKDEHFHAFIWK